MTLETAARLTQLRKERGLSQEELAEELHVSRQAVSKWERAESSPDTDNLIALGQLYGITLDELIHGGQADAVSMSEASAAGEAVPAAEEPAPQETIDPDNPLPNGRYYEHMAERKRRSVPYPALVTAAYLVLGAVFGLWHPLVDPVPDDPAVLPAPVAAELHASAGESGHGDDHLPAAGLSVRPVASGLGGLSADSAAELEIALMRVKKAACGPLF